MLYVYASCSRQFRYVSSASIPVSITETLCCLIRSGTRTYLVENYLYNAEQHGIPAVDNNPKPVEEMCLDKSEVFTRGLVFVQRSCAVRTSARRFNNDLVSTVVAAAAAMVCLNVYVCNECPLL